MGSASPYPVFPPGIRTQVRGGETHCATASSQWAQKSLGMHSVGHTDTRSSHLPLKNNVLPNEIQNYANRMQIGGDQFVCSLFVDLRPVCLVGFCYFDRTSRIANTSQTLFIGFLRRRFEVLAELTFIIYESDRRSY